MSATITFQQSFEIFKAIHQVAHNDIRITPILWGNKAIGKSEMVGQFAKQIGANCVSILPSQMEPSDLIGIPRERDGQTFWACPDWFSNAIKDERPCVFFVDEFTRAESFTQQALFEFLLKGKLHTHQIRPFDMVVAASNPNSAEYDINFMQDDALLSRFAHFYLEPTAEEYLSYLRNTKCHAAIIKTISTHLDVIDSGVAVDPALKYVATPDRRNIFKIGMIMNFLSEEQIKSIGFSLFSAMVGPDLAQNIMHSYKEFEMLSINDILDGTIFVKDIDFESDLDKLSILNDALVRYMVNKNNHVHKKPRQLKSIKFHNKTLYLKEVKHLNNIRTYVSKIPIDQQFGFLRTLRYEWETLITKDSQYDFDHLVCLITSIDEDLVTKLIS